MVDFLEEHFVLAVVDARHERRREDWAGDMGANNLTELM
jgi:hypothetical protein